VVMRLAREQANLGAEVSIVTVSSENERRSFDAWVGQSGPSANLNLVLWPGGWIPALRGGRHVHELYRRNDIVHVHGVWDPLVTHCLAARVPSSARVVLAPHGMLSRWSLRQKKLKKRLAWNLWIGSALRHVDRFHALNDAETVDLRALLPNASIGVLANGTDSVRSQDQTASGFARPAARPAGKHILFLARLHPVKGPDLLIDAFARCVRIPTFPREIELVVAGPDFGMLGELRRRVAQLGITDRVKFPGAVYGSDKEALLKGAVALCQPSRYEAFGLTLLEAMAHGVPVITTRECHSPANSAADCALVVPGEDVDALSSALSRVIADPGLRERMGSAGRLLVEQHYTWDKIAEQALNLYERSASPVPDAAELGYAATARTGH
jgi:glycosyltransferase involved in cell wall biosynthesis